MIPPIPVCLPSSAFEHWGPHYLLLGPVALAAFVLAHWGCPSPPRQRAGWRRWGRPESLRGLLLLARLQPQREDVERFPPNKTWAKK